MAAIIWRFSMIWGREADAKHPLCAHPSEEDVCTELFTYAIRKIIIRLEMVAPAFFVLSVGVVWWNQQRTKEFWLLQLWRFRWWCGRNIEKRKFWDICHFTFLNWGERTCLGQKVTVVTRKIIEKLRILRKRIFGKSLTKYAPSGFQKTIRKRKSRYRFF